MPGWVTDHHVVRQTMSSQNAKVKFTDLLEAFEFVSGSAFMEHHAYLARDTGLVFWVSDFIEVSKEFPDDFETSDRYLAIPHKNDLDLGRELVLDFVEEHWPTQLGRVTEIFRRQGAYGRFKDLLASEGRLEQWYYFEAKATEQALREWCRENDVHLREDDAGQSV
jgi:hypothetical protein